MGDMGSGETWLSAKYRWHGDQCVKLTRDDRVFCSSRDVRIKNIFPLCIAIAEVEHKR